jgi:hypothetical protein
MDRQDAIQTLSKIGKISVSYAEDLYDSFFEKPVVPQYVADWYEEHKGDIDYDFWEYLVDWEQQEPNDFKNWVNREYNTITTLVNMHQFGYEVEKEKRYRVDFKKFASNFRVLKYHLQFKNWFTGNDSKYDYTRMYHTRKELEDAGFGWVFSCEGIEVKEVTDE